MCGFVSQSSLNSTDYQLKSTQEPDEPEKMVIGGKMHHNLMTKNGAGRGEFQSSERSNPYIYELPFVFYPRAIRISISDNLHICRRWFVCLQFDTIDNIIRRNGRRRKGDMLQQGNGPLILRRNSNWYPSVR